MSLKGSPINWWKEKRQASHSGIPAASRPATAFPWTGDRDLQKIVEETVLAAFESDAFKVAIASQVDPTFSRHQEKLNQIKAANLNLESTLQAFVEDLPVALRPIQDQLTALDIPEYGLELEELSKGQKTLESRLNEVQIPNYENELSELSKGQKTLESRLNDVQIPNYEKELNEISSGQSKLLKFLENRFSGLETRIEELDRKIEGLDESIVNADLRSAIRFGELSNELQDRNTMLGDRIWGVERDLGKKIDGQQRKIVDTYEELRKDARSANDTLETIQAKMNEDSLLTEVKKAVSKVEIAEKTLRRNMIDIQEKVSNIETSVVSLQSSKLDLIDTGMSEIKKELGSLGKITSSDSRLLSTNASKLDDIISVVGKVQNLAESTNEVSREVWKSQKLNAASAKESMEAVQLNGKSLDSMAVSHSKTLEDAVSSITRMEKAFVSLDTASLSKLGNLESIVGRVEQGLTPLSSHSAKLDGLQLILGGLHGEVKPQKAVLDNLATTISELTANICAMSLSYDESMKSVQQKLDDTSSFDQLISSLSEVQGSIEQKVSSSLSIIQNDTSSILKGIEDAEKIAVSNKDNVVENLRSSAQANILMKEDITTLQTTILQTLQNNTHTLEEMSGFKPIEEVSTKVDRFATSVLSAMANSYEDLQSASRSSKEEIIHQLQTLDGSFRTELGSMTNATDCRLQKLDIPIANILDEFRSNKALFEVEKTKIYEEFELIKTLVEDSKSMHIKDANSIMSMLQDEKKLRKDDEILNQIEYWGQTCVSKQATDILTVVGLLEGSQQRDELIQKSVADLGEKNSSMFEFLQSGDITSSSTLHELNAIKFILEDDDNTTSIKQISLDSIRLLNEVQHNVHQLGNDPTIGSIKQLLGQNASAITMTHGDILALDAKVKTGEEFLYSAVQQLQTTLEKHILDVVSSVTSSMDHDMVDLKNELGTRISIATNVLRTEVKEIDSTVALASLRDGLQSYSTTIHDNTKLVAEDLESRISLLIGSVTKIINDFRDDHGRISQENVVTLSHLEEISTTKSASISEDLSKLQQGLGVLSETREDVGLVITAVQRLDQTVNNNSEILSAIRDNVSRTDNLFDAVSEKLKTTIDTHSAETLQAVENNHSILSNSQQASNELLHKMQEDIKAINTELASTIGESQITKASILSSITSNSAGIISEFQSAKNSYDDDFFLTKSSLQDTRKAVDTMSAVIQETLDQVRSEAVTAQQIIVEKINSESSTLSGTIIRGAESSSIAVDGVKDSLILEVQNLKTGLAFDLTAAQKSLQNSMEYMSTDFGARFADFSAESKNSREVCDANFVMVSKSFRHEAETAQAAIETLRNHVISEVQKTNLVVSSLLDVMKSDIEGVSGDLHTVSSNIRDEIKCLDIKTTNGITGLELAVEQSNTSLSKSIGENKVLFESSFNNVLGGVKAVDAAVRVNSAAIARVDKAVLETGSQVKAVIHDGNREVLSQLEEELYQSGTRIKGISNFDIPRIEAIGKRNRDILEVIGTRVVGTAKKFEELMALHSHKSSDHNELLNGRLRNGSNASSSRDSVLRMSTT
jgi:hypothetical protein